jgi:hypothetical protein
VSFFGPPLSDPSAGSLCGTLNRAKDVSVFLVVEQGGVTWVRTGQFS